MFRIINFDNVSCLVRNNILLKDINFCVEKGEFVSVIGSNGSGKSTLVKVLSGFMKYNGYINVNGYCLDKNNISHIRKMMGVVLNDMDSYFVGDNVYNQIYIGLNNLGLSDNEIKSRIDNIIKLFNLEHIVFKEVCKLTNSEKQIVRIASVLSRDIDILVMDDSLNRLDANDKKFVLDIIKWYKKNKKLTIIMVSNDIESVLYGDRVIVLDKGKIVMDGSTISVLKQVDKLERYGIGSIFSALLSFKFIEKGIVNHVYLDMRKLVDRLWK